MLRKVQGKVVMRDEGVGNSAFVIQYLSNFFFENFDSGLGDFYRNQVAIDNKCFISNQKDFNLLND